MTLSKIKYRLVLLWITYCIKLGFEKQLLGKMKGNRILVFHGIDEIGDTRFNSRFLSQTAFERLISYLSEHGNIISLKDYFEKKFKPGVLNIALTFDDGLKNNYDLAIPFLEKHRIPATFFVTSATEVLWPDFLDLVSFYTSKTEITFDGKTYKKNRKNEFEHEGISLKNRCKQLEFKAISPLFSIFESEWNSVKEKPLDTYWKLMDTAELEYIASHPIFTLGAHSHTHTNLGAIPIDNAKVEMEECKRHLEEKTGIPISYFAFPFGTHSPKLIQVGKKLGYSKLLATRHHQHNRTENKSPDLFRRLVVNPHIGVSQQLYFIKRGGYL